MGCVNQQLSCYQLLNKLSTGACRLQTRCKKRHVQAAHPLGYRLPNRSNGCLEIVARFDPATARNGASTGPEADQPKADRFEPGPAESGEAKSRARRAFLLLRKAIEYPVLGVPDACFIARFHTAGNTDRARPSADSRRWPLRLKCGLRERNYSAGGNNLGCARVVRGARRFVPWSSCFGSRGRGY
jgi:hypothetical protein